MAVLAGAERFPAGAVVNVGGTWWRNLQRFGAPVPVLPRRGFILVTEPLPRVVRHKVYSADYVANIASSDAGLETSVVVEGTRGGTILIGASRERVRFDTNYPSMSFDGWRRRPSGCFPCSPMSHCYGSIVGSRPYCPDHLPVIGPDRRLPGLPRRRRRRPGWTVLAPSPDSDVAGREAGASCGEDSGAVRPDEVAHLHHDLRHYRRLVADLQRHSTQGRLVVRLRHQVWTVGHADAGGYELRALDRSSDPSRERVIRARAGPGPGRL